MLKKLSAAFLFLALTSISSLAPSPAGDSLQIPSPPREFRGVWVATVNNGDWPSSRNLSTQEQQQELVAILDRCKQLNLNAVIFQVQPACDSFYPSDIVPWSEYLTGQQGHAPSPMWDPLEFAIREAHRRGLELHAWFNPFRAMHSTAKGPLAANHVSKTHPQIVKTYGKQLWLDPGVQETHDFALSTIVDVLKRYDVDAIHFDDYFYPYREKSAGDFPDDGTYQKYTASGGTLAKDDWRRDNINRFVARVSKTVHQMKPGVRFGISPFGIWQPGNPPGIVGMNPVKELYADSRKWFSEGTVDYIAPQLYWAIKPPQQSYPALLHWWTEQNRSKRHLWPGNGLYRLGSKGWPASEIASQIEITRKESGATGNILFSMKNILVDTAGIRAALESENASQALVPATTWLDSTPPPAPQVEARRDGDGATLITWRASQGETPWLFAVYARVGNGWQFAVVPGGQTAYKLTGETPGAVAVSEIDRCGNEGRRSAAAVAGQ